MKKVYYMSTKKISEKQNEEVILDKIGGKPTHKPENFTVLYQEEELGFILQIYNDGKKFTNADDVLCWQIYQDIDEEDEPIIVEVPRGAELNSDREGLAIERLEESVIIYEKDVEPDVLYSDGTGISKEEEKYYSSKIGGAVPEEYLDYDKTYLGCIKELFCENHELNFGGILYLMKNNDGKVELEIY